MVRNLLEVISQPELVRRAALVTGLKHYLGPFESYGKGKLPATPFREEQPASRHRKLLLRSGRRTLCRRSPPRFGWNVHRPHTIIGYALGNAMNMGVTLAVYATICRETGRPFLFPGSSVQWNSLTDMTDARLLARHLEWAATTPAARDQAFNVVNGDVFRWNWMWSRLAAWFGIEAAPLPGQSHAARTTTRRRSTHMAENRPHPHLVEPDLNHLVSAWHTDADLGRPIEVVTDMSKSRKLGFLDYQATDDSFFELFTRLRQDRIIPSTNYHPPKHTRPTQLRHRDGKPSSKSLMLP